MENAFKTITENIALVRGDTLTFQFDLQKLITEDAPTAYAEQDLTSCAFCCKRNYDDEENAFEKTLGNGIEKVATGKYRIRIAPDDTAELDVTNYYYELEIGFGTDVFTVMRGVLELQYDINPSGGGGGDLASLSKIVDGTITEVTATQLYGSTKIRTNAFFACESLVSADLPDTVESIENQAFIRCSALTRITIPNSVISIGQGAFSGCTGLTNIVLPNGITTIKSQCFSASGLTSIVLPDGITSIGNYAFQNCTELATVTIPESVTTIEGNAFSGCAKLTDLTIPGNVTSISNGTFQRCSSLRRVSLPKTIVSIGNSAFLECTSLESFTIAAITPPTITNNTFLSAKADMVIYVPAGSVDAYKSAQYWSTRAAYIQAIPQN